MSKFFGIVVRDTDFDTVSPGYVHQGNGFKIRMEMGEGAPPVAYKQTILAFAGVVYNEDELVLRFLKDLRSATTAQTIAALYRQKGVDFLKEVNGDFSFALFLPEENKIILARDAMGVRPLYVYERNGMLAFGTHIQSFKKAGLPLSVNEEAIGRYLIFKYSPGEETLYKEVKKIMPGTVLEVNLATAERVQIKYRSVFDGVVPYKGSFADACQELKYRFDNAMERRLQTSALPANFLSGGLDSSIIAYYLKDTDAVHYTAVKSQADLQAEGTTSDGYYAKKLAAEWNLDLKQVPIGEENFSLPLIQKAVGITPDLIADGSIIPSLLMAQTAAQNSRVVLSGMGADELFLGYNGHFLMRLSGMVSKVPALQPVLGALFRSIRAGSGPFKAYRRYLQKWGNNMGKDFEPARYSVVGDVDSAMRVVKSPVRIEEFLKPFFPKGRDPFEALFEFETDNFLVKNLHYLYFSGSEYGIEARVPFLDPDVVQFAASLPLSYKMDAMLTSKKILKSAFKPHLPTYITRRRKAGFGMPLRSLLANKELTDRILPLSYFSERPYFNSQAIKEILHLHHIGKQDHSALIYALICFKVWEKQH